MKSINQIKNIDELIFLENYNEVESFSQGVKMAEQHFKECEIEGTVCTSHIKTFEIRGERDYDVYVYECYVDSASNDYFHFSYETFFN
jgi:hypothetical protein